MDNLVLLVLLEQLVEQDLEAQLVSQDPLALQDLRDRQAQRVLLVLPVPPGQLEAVEIVDSLAILV